MTSAQPEKRVRRPRHIFSPDDNPIRPSHYLLHFDSTDSYNIALSSSIGNITGQTATLNIHGKKTLATIVTSGTFECCENEQIKISRESQQTFDDVQPETLHFDEDFDRCLSPQQEGLIGTYSLLNRQPATRIKHHPHALLNDDNANSDADADDNDEEINHQPGRSSHSHDASGSKQKSSINRKKRKQPPTKSNKSKRQRKNAENSPGGEDERAIRFTDSSINSEIKSKDVLNQIENHIVIFHNFMTKKFKVMEKKLDLHIGSNLSLGTKILDQYRNEKGEVFQTEYIYQNRNLLTTPSKDLLDFARRTMKILFSPEELKTHILPPERDHLKRPALDQTRFNILMEVIRIKFRLDSDLMQQFFNDLLRTKLSNFLYEERRRESRRRLRDRERMLMRNMLQPIQDDYRESVHGEDDGRI